MASLHEYRYAGMAALERAAANTIEKRLLNARGRPSFNLVFYAVNTKGEHAVVSPYESSGKEPARYALCTDDGPRTLPTEPMFPGTPEG
jgi:hypothetical protein